MATNVMTNAGAGAAVVSPWWLPALHDVSAFAAEIVPILGAAWLIVQIIAKVAEIMRKKDGTRQTIVDEIAGGTP
jgi:hypothetical protein